MGSDHIYDPDPYNRFEFMTALKDGIRVAVPFSRLLTPTRTMATSVQKVRVLSWNIDMDTPPITPRTSAILHEIRNQNPDVVMLQEVTKTSYNVLRVLWDPPKDSNNPKYDLHINPSWAEDLPYFSLLLTRERLLGESQTTVQRFPASIMFRGYIAASGKLSNGVNAMFVTSHLESLKDRSAERKDQLLQILDIIREHVDGGGAGIFAGDTNLREAEVPAKEVAKKMIGNSGPASQKFADAWLEAGSKVEDKFTWDTQANDNLEMNISFRPKARYDRAFLLPSNQIVTKSFTTLGKERLACGVYASDHWGICIDLDFS